MHKKIFPPIFVLETETGDITLYSDMEDLRNIVEEFWDILEEDFRFWDKDCCPMKFEKSFLDKNDYGITITTKSEYQTVKSYLLKYAENKGVSIVVNAESEELVNLYNVIAQSLKTQ